MSDDAFHGLVRDWWDADAESYERSTGHALTDPVEAAAWTAALRALLPPAPAEILDVGAGTGSMSLLAASLGHRVTGLDLSEAMLGFARDKARAAGYDITFVRGRAEEPPQGPFDAVIERHVAWTLRAPADTFTAWRAATRPGGRLVLLEGSWGGDGPLDRAREAALGVWRRVTGIGNDHHAPYPDEIVREAPLAGAASPGPFIDAVRQAGWGSVRLIRLRDVEWAAASHEPILAAWLGHRVRFAIVAEAPATATGAG
jgi:SAM-dependent methyltransferase